ncbi:MAG: DUF2141 domain-containing protein [Saprospiraceae bacterium]|nr:DUF2141 domain-containing protein [Saprospiraceae bacterium]
MMNKKNLLITGASGAVGSEILKQLSELTDMFKITVFDLKTRESVKFLNKFDKIYEIVYGDITNNDDVEKVCHNVDFVIHLAAIIPPKADKLPDLSKNVNVGGTKCLVRNLELFSPNSFLVYASSISVYGDRLKNPWITVTDPLTPSEGDEYALTKIEAERVIKKSKIDWSIFRLTAIMGKHKLSELLFHMPLNTPLEIATPAGTAKAFVEAINNTHLLSKKIYNLGGGASYRILYKDFLSRSFEAVGLGKLNFPEKSFAERNFHCGYYADSNELEDVLKFQRGTVDDYFYSLRKSTNVFKRFFTWIFSGIIKRVLLSKSEPLKAFRLNDVKLKKRFFAILFILISHSLFSQSHSLVLNISNIKPYAGIIRIGIYNNEDDWLNENKEFKVVTIVAEKGEISINVPGLPNGEYAVTMYQDENSNNKCDKSFFGIPIERIGFSNNTIPKLFKPSFDECKFSITAKKTVNIRLITL